MAFKVSNDTRRNLIAQGKFLVTEITFDVVEEMIGWIFSNRPSKRSFTILINSSGGKPSAVVYLSSVLRTLPKDVRIHGVAFGVCGSAALALLQCCNTRIAVGSCGFFVHNLQTRVEIDCRNPDKERIRDEIDQARSIEDELVQLQCDRTGISKKKWHELANLGEKNPGRGIIGRNAVALGLVDKVVERYAIF